MSCSKCNLPANTLTYRRQGGHGQQEVEEGPGGVGGGDGVHGGCRGELDGPEGSGRRG